jgi:hypothetical protein
MQTLRGLIREMDRPYPGLGLLFLFGKRVASGRINIREQHAPSA